MPELGSSIPIYECPSSLMRGQNPFFENYDSIQKKTTSIIFVAFSENFFKPTKKLDSVMKYLKYPIPNFA